MTEPATRLSPEDLALVGTIYDPPRARQPWMLKDVLPDGVTRCYSLARWALVDALRACGVRPGDRVLVPGLICREVLASLNLLGATVAFYPVSPRLCAGFGAGDLVDAKAVLAVNYFGFPQGLGPFREYCARTGAMLIEDNAHGLLSRDDNGQLLGSRGDAGLFSIRKTIAVPDGAALVLKNRALPQTAEAHEAAGIPSRYRLKQAFRRVSRALGPIRTHSAIGVVREMRRGFTGHAMPVAASDAETRIPVGPSPSSLFSRAVTVADPDVEAQRRRALYELAGRIVATTGAVPVFPFLPPNVVPYGFPVSVSSEQVSATAANVGQHGFQLARWPDLPEAIVREALPHYRQLMVLPFLW